MGSPIGSLIANIFMCDLEDNLIPKIKNDIKHWFRYVDYTFAFIKPEAILEVQHI